MILNIENGLSKEIGIRNKSYRLDEIHKFSRWKNFLKGTYDTQKQDHQFIVTGSARLDIYKGQDSMLGRFFSWRLHPLCLAELKQHFHLSDPANVIKLLNLGGFPDPFFPMTPHLPNDGEMKKLI